MELNVTNQRGGHDDGAILVLTLVLTVVMAVIAVALATYAATGLRTSKVTDVRLADESAAAAAVEYVADALATTDAGLAADPCVEVLPITPEFWGVGAQADVDCVATRRPDRLSVAVRATAGQTAIDATIDVRAAAVDTSTGRRPVAVVGWRRLTEADEGGSTTTAAPVTTTTTTTTSTTTTTTTTTTVPLPPLCSFEVVGDSSGGRKGTAEVEVRAVADIDRWAIDLLVPSDVTWTFEWPDDVSVVERSLSTGERAIEVSGPDPIKAGRSVTVDVDLGRSSGTKIDKGDTLDCFGI